MEILSPILRMWGIWTSHLFRMSPNIKYEVAPLVNPEQRCLIIANHRSFADIPVMCGIFGSPFLMKKEILKMPIIGWGAKIYGNLPVNRSKQTSRQKAAKVLIDRIVNETSMVSFPEGTRSKSENLGEKVHLGLLKRAYESNIMVQPVFLHGTQHVFSKWGLLSSLTKKQAVHLSVLKRIDPKEFDDKNTFALASWKSIVDEFENFKSSPALSKD